MNFQRTAEASDDNTPLESFGAVNVFPAGLTQLQYVPRTGEALNVLNIVQQGMAENNALFREQNKQIADAETATSARILGELQAESTQANAALFLAQWGSVLQEIFNRLRKKGSKDPDAVKFVERCQF